MTRAELEHAIRAACDLAGDTEVIVFGSQAILGWCVEAHDLAASKLVAFREKDRDFVRTLLAEMLVKPTKLRTRIRQLRPTPDDVEREARLIRWVDRTARELSA
ncbi:MAG TPA: hypothetical protein VF041_17390 [Gemmatimonadaceae bacterium]